MASIDYLALARRSSREAFVAAMPHPFLVSRGEVDRPDGPRSTLVFEVTSLGDPTTAEPPDPTPQPGELEPLVLAVRKVQPNFPAMITVGRTANNDIVIPDVSVSKFHAFFRSTPEGPLELADAGSRNGTWVGRDKLVPRGAAVRLAIGTTVKFAKIGFTLLDAAGLWQSVREKK